MSDSHRIEHLRQNAITCQELSKNICTTNSGKAIYDLSGHVQELCHIYADLTAKLKLAVEALGDVTNVVNKAPSECPHEKNYVISGACPCCGLISEMHGFAKTALAKIGEQR